MVYKSVLLGILTLLMTFSQDIRSETIVPDGYYLDTSELAMLNHRTSHFVVSESDLDYIKKYISDYFNGDYQKEQPPLDGHLYIFKGILEKIQLPAEHINLIQRYGVALLSYDLDKLKASYAKDIIWWSAARMIKHNKEFKLFVNNQMTSGRWKDALHLLVEKGMTDEISKFSEYIENKDTIDSILELSLRKSKVINFLKKQNEGYLSEIITEISLSITDVMPFIQKKRGAKRFDHLDWLIKQLGLHKSNPEIKQILENLIEDDLYYSKEVFKREEFQNFTNREIENIKSDIDAHLLISNRVKQALYPEFILEYNVIE